MSPRLALQIRSASALLLLLTVIASCGADPEPVHQTLAEERGVPDWVTKGSDFDGANDDSYYGVGVASGIQNLSLARNTAAARARADVARFLESYLQNLIRDYQASATDFELARVEEQVVDEAVESYTSVAVPGVKIIEYWQDPVDGTMYALAELRFEDARNALSQVRQLEDPVLQRMRERALTVFQELEEREYEQVQ